MVHALNKGKGFERDIAHLLTEITEVKWMRVPMSGAHATINKSTDPRFNGDVFTEDETYKDIVIECKSYKDLQINDLFNEKSKFYKWIKQCITESDGKRWVLFIKINHRGVYMLADGLNLISSCFVPNKKIIIVNKRIFLKLK